MELTNVPHKGKNKNHLTSTMSQITSSRSQPYNWRLAFPESNLCSLLTLFLENSRIRGHEKKPIMFPTPLTGFPTWCRCMLEKKPSFPVDFIVCLFFRVDISITRLNVFSELNNVLLSGSDSNSLLTHELVFRWSREKLHCSSCKNWYWQGETVVSVGILSQTARCWSSPGNAGKVISQLLLHLGWCNVTRICPINCQWRYATM